MGGSCFLLSQSPWRSLYIVRQHRLTSPNVPLQCVFLTTLSVPLFTVCGNAVTRLSSVELILVQTLKLTRLVTAFLEDNTLKEVVRAVNLEK
ncbi:hypothetical protein RRG08_036633 [Elysia crispata]|uniref:Uncharacterized protein n=1 Tax=Elysia crispata TaxID=231223 RepID=A0AAE1D356_9GAST|nr:hypothetical protein RRG08_036633 [Elysia crispata]